MVRERQQKSEKFSNLGARLREARELLGITQEKLGERWGKTGNYIYMLEAGIKPVPKKLELQIVELEGEVRRKLYSHLEPTKDPNSLTLNDVAPLKQVDAQPGAPVVSWASAGGGGVFGDLATQIDEWVPTDCKDPNAYSLIVQGDSMSPKMEAGDRIVVTPNAAAVNGDVVVARLIETGEVFLKLYHEAQGKVRLTSFNAAYPEMEYRRAAFRFIQPVYALLRRMRAVKR